MREQFRHAERLVPRPALYVAADLSVTTMPIASLEFYGEDLTQRDDDGQLRAYRCLGLRWYQWLFHAMARAQARVAEGKLPDASWQIMRARFRIVWDWMRANHDHEEIHAVEACYCDARYLPPEIRDARAYLLLFQAGAA